MPEAENAATLEKPAADLNLQVAAFDAGDFKDEVIAVARKVHAEIYVDRLGPADDREHWQDAIDRGATGIQTNKPGELVEYLRARGMHR
jgi:glycerophosphoryl diester phosphodiesterase